MCVFSIVWYAMPSTNYCRFTWCIHRSHVWPDPSSGFFLSLGLPSLVFPVLSWNKSTIQRELCLHPSVICKSIKVQCHYMNYLTSYTIYFFLFTLICFRVKAQKLVYTPEFHLERICMIAFLCMFCHCCLWFLYYFVVEFFTLILVWHCFQSHWIPCSPSFVQYA